MRDAELEDEQAADETFFGLQKSSKSFLCKMANNAWAFYFEMLLNYKIITEVIYLIQSMP